ncbi:P-loop containing nucleoside triphosphate hydrolase [Pochonia chlamydosporia 170]|uniref:P-loop containing nucleoside triphosphate hydrolase n=1 Tax=Pochonia chlamydosporia 170 TaxID=1380566 RepID=A0A179G1Z5_METCM|nr:P-loop containing nucleoside triphosphate hydrolase [Pochonia chlamydosporia 170]OAQ71371.1 P-loop containing nucleoside triphosphate hydrolase [Pochonia chlamydosporia 170]
MPNVEETDDAVKSPLLIISYPRTASNLFMRMLSLPDQDDALSPESGGYFFYPAIGHMREAGLLDKPPQQWTEEETKTTQLAFQACYDKLQGLIDTAADQGKLAVIKEHAPFMMSPTVQSNFVHNRQDLSTPWKVAVPNTHSIPNTHSVPNTHSDSEPNTHAVPNLGYPLNESVLPDHSLLKCTPTFLIRHPALAFPSYYRVKLAQGMGSEAQDPMNQLVQACTLRWTRNLYDWYTFAWEAVTPRKTPPVILDADDMLDNPELVRHFCDYVGLDSTKVRFEWSSISKDDLANEHPIRRHTRATLLTSSGIERGKTFFGLSVEGEVEKWKDEFGHPAADRLEGWVRAAMPDYEYLRGRRLVM